jgi:hypothetical protein
MYTTALTPTNKRGRLLRHIFNKTIDLKIRTIWKIISSYKLTPKERYWLPTLTCRVRFDAASALN